MKLKLISLCAVFCAQAYATPQPEAEGIYVADSTISMAPPRTTFALIEQNGEVWSAVDWFTQTAAALTGKINTKKGDGNGVDFAPFAQPTVMPLQITTAITSTTVHFTFFSNGEQSVVHHRFHPQAKPGAYDFDLTKQATQALTIPSNVYSSNGATMMVIGDEVSGSFGNCTFTGDLNPTNVDYFKRVQATISGDCYNDQSLLKKGTKLDGVIFKSTRAQVPVELLVLIMKSKGNEKIGFSRTFVVTP